MSQRRLDEFTTIAIRKEQKEKIDAIKLKIKAKTYAEVIDLLLKHYESTHTHQPETSSNTEDEDSEIVEEEVKTFQSMIMPAELEEKIAESCKNNPELRAYVMYFVKKYKLDKYKDWAEQWNREIDCSKWT